MKSFSNMTLPCDLGCRVHLSKCIWFNGGRVLSRSIQAFVSAFSETGNYSNTSQRFISAFTLPEPTKLMFRRRRRKDFMYPWALKIVPESFLSKQGITRQFFLVHYVLCNIFTFCWMLRVSGLISRSTSASGLQRVLGPRLSPRAVWNCLSNVIQNPVPTVCSWMDQVQIIFSQHRRLFSVKDTSSECSL